MENKIKQINELLKLSEYSGTPISKELGISKEEAQECLKQIEARIPEYGSAYFYVDSLGQIMCDTWYADASDRYRFECGNCFKTKEEILEERLTRCLKVEY